MGSAGTIADIEKQVILIRYRLYRGNKTQTAISLGISVRTLDTKLEEYEKDGQRFKANEEREARERKEQLDRARGIIVDPKTGRRSLLGSDTGAYQETNGESAAAGVDEKSSSESIPVHAVPLSKREETKVVLPPQVSAGGNRGRR